MNKAKALVLTVALVAASLHAQENPNTVKGDTAPSAKDNEVSKKAASETKVTSPIWEYKTVAVAEQDNKEAERIAALGIEGWELVSVVYVPTFAFSTASEKGVTTGKLSPQLRYYFKRKKSSSAQ